MKCKKARNNKNAVIDPKTELKVVLLLIFIFNILNKISDIF